VINGCGGNSGFGPGSGVAIIGGCGCIGIGAMPGGRPELGLRACIVPGIGSSPSVDGEFAMLPGGIAGGPLDSGIAGGELAP
jgi:hypothetical protein